MLYPGSPRSYQRRSTLSLYRWSDEITIMFGSLAGIIIAVVIAVIIYYVLKKAVYLVYNAVIGIVALFLINMTGIFGDPGIPINIVKVLISAIGGIIGVIIIILLHVLGIPL